MGGLAPGNECAILDFPCIGVVGGGFPAIECLAIAQQGEPGFDLGSSRCTGTGSQCPGHKGEK